VKGCLPYMRLHRPWMTKSQSTTDYSQPTSTLKAESLTSSGGVNATPQPTPIPGPSGILPTNLAMVPPPKEIPAISPILDNLAKAWDAVKDGPKVAITSRGLDAVGVSSAPYILSTVADPGF
jgi:hypothetical protein